MANVLRLGQRLAGDTADSNKDSRLHDLDQAFDENPAGGDLLTRRPAVGQRLAGQMRMGWDSIPENHAPLGAEFFEDAVDDRSRGFFPRSRAAARTTVRIAPAQQVELAGEGNARPAHPLVAGRFPNGEDIGLRPFLEVVPP